MCREAGVSNGTLKLDTEDSNFSDKSSLTPSPNQRGVMGFWKFPPFLVLSILVLYQAGMFHAAPFRSVFDGRFDPATLDEEESRLLLAAMVNDYEQMRARESEKAQKTEGSR
ncbi:hypothetical protein E5288_WYG005924 [Bos mutus]|uniref:Calcitonin receptor-stimulating peptide 1 n=1 Tax=Bos mutus TaxID=72004 RepID=A0A6B0R1L4_9CETA|nr:hypothetical protein [Bos mutus]